VSRVAMSRARGAPSAGTSSSASRYISDSMPRARSGSRTDAGSSCDARRLRSRQPAGADLAGTKSEHAFRRFVA
jgi:hypothetical protein